MKLVRDTTGEVMDMPPPEIAVIPVGALQANCYLVTCPETRETIIIDPGADAAAIARHIREHDLPVSAIVHTHGHFDHINATEAVLEELGQSGPVIAHAADAFLYAGEARAAGAMFGYLAPPRLMIPDLTMEAGDALEVGALRLAVRHTPGHTPGSVSLVCGNWCVFSGDTLFRRGIGRTDLAGGDEDAIYESILTHLYTLPVDMQVYPGHGPGTTIGEEATDNPFVQANA